ncbi:GNAT family N-acetyltransferase [Celeribacter arenosi]|uniref:GNAT family N-acetyltransferase n=1 Tax=Celeribacter arenosi TaxID=792649 RepID=A0ABP7K0D8_9RHOB
MSEQITITVSSTITDIAPDEWDACARAPATGTAPDPFTTHRFLAALEASGSVGTGTGWHPRYLMAKRGEDTIAVAPAYLKSHSQGEYVFDFQWAHAYENAGGRYYPKLQIAVPFTPVTGPRLLTREGCEEIGQAALVQGAVQLCDQMGLSSLHITFCTDTEAAAGEDMGLLTRLGQQFHWENNGYADFDAFLAALSSRKRKNIRRERAQAQSFGGEIIQLTGDAIQPEHWDAFWTFYQDTGARKWGTPYLTRAFFDHVHETMRSEILLILATRDGHPVAGALNFIGQNTLFGRYWGCSEHHPALHFELCYYQAIDYAIANGLTRVEAGAQGEHKLARGYLPNETHSLHWIADAGFRRAIADYLDQERAAVGEEVSLLTAYGPFRKTNQESDHD